MSKEKQDQQVAISQRKLGGESPIVINEIVDNCLYSGFFGTLDSVRMKNIMDDIVNVAEKADYKILIVDLSNMDIVDSAIAGHLIRLNKTLQLVGLDVIYCGIKPIVAQSIVSAGVELSDITVYKNLKIALKEVYNMLGLKLVPIKE